MLKWWMHLTMGMVLGFIMTVSAVTLAAKSGEVWMSCYAETIRMEGSPERWVMTLKCGKGDIVDKVALR